MLLPSPMKATRRPSSPAPVLEEGEAVGQHLAGMCRSERPLITGTLRVRGELDQDVSCETCAP